MTENPRRFDAVQAPPEEAINWSGVAPADHPLDILVQPDTDQALALGYAQAKTYRHLYLLTLELLGTCQAKLVRAEAALRAAQRRGSPL